jgi:hypothetical protein
LVSDIPAGDGKNDNLFFTVYWFNLPGMLAAADRGEEVVHREVQLEQGALEGGQLHHRLL